MLLTGYSPDSVNFKKFDEYGSKNRWLKYISAVGLGYNGCIMFFRPVS